MRFLLGFISATMFIAIVFIGCWLYFDFPISTNDETNQQTSHETTHETSHNQSNVNYEQPTQATEQKHNGFEPPTNKPERMNNLHNTEKAVQLMRSHRSDLSDEDKQLYDGVIETAKTNINNGVANAQDYSYLNMYKKLEKVE